MIPKVVRADRKVVREDRKVVRADRKVVREDRKVFRALCGICGSLRVSRRRCSLQGFIPLSRGAVPNFGHEVVAKNVERAARCPN